VAAEEEGAAVFAGLVDLASKRVGGEALVCSDDFFAGMENLVEDGRGVFLPDEYTERGKWMDGWESRRKREPGFDWCILRLGLPGVLRGVDVDTNHFLGNHPAFASLEACYLAGDPSPAELLGGLARWQEVVPQAPLKRGSQNLLCVRSEERFTHVRLNIYPDGGVARLRCYGEVVPDLTALPPGKPLDLAGLENGGRVLGCSDMFFGNMQNLIMPGDAENMGQGWETRRKREWSYDWVVVALATRGTLDRLVIDTKHFKGNFPDHCVVEGLDSPEGHPRFYAGEDHDWVPVLGETKLTADTAHAFESELASRGPFTHLRLRIYPDGGVSRLRAFGTPEGGSP